MAKVISGYVVSRNVQPGYALPWRAWHTAHDKPTLVADTYNGLLAMIRAARGDA